MSEVHTTVGVYLNGDHVVNGVNPDHLDAHIAYNMKNRFGRALLVDGECVYTGYYADGAKASLEEKYGHIRAEKESDQYC